MSKQYRVILFEGERAPLGQRVAAGNGPARDLTHARILAHVIKDLADVHYPDAERLYPSIDG